MDVEVVGMEKEEDRFNAKPLLYKCEEFMLEELNPAVAFRGMSAYAPLDDLKVGVTM